MPSGEKSSKQRAGRDGEVGSVLGVAGESEPPSSGAKAIVLRSDSTVASTASDSFS